MDLGEILRVLRARWYIMAPMMLLAAGLSVATAVVVPASYESYSTVSLLSSPSSTEAATQGEDNPFLNFNGSLVAMADFLGRSLQSTEAETELRDRGVTEDYKVALAEGAQGPFLTITVTGTDKRHTQASTQTLTEYAAAQLAEIQRANGVKTQDMIRLTQIIPPQEPAPKLKKKIEMILAVGGGALALAFLVTFVVESVARSRRRRKVAEGATAAEPVARGATSMPSPSASAAVPWPGAVGGAGPQPAGRTVDETVAIEMPARPGRAQPAQSQPTADETVVLTIPTKGESGMPGFARGARDRGQASPELYRSGKAGQVPADPPPPASPKRPVSPIASSTTYRSSEGSDRRGQDADRVNGS